MRYTIEQIMSAWAASAEHEWSRNIRDDQNGQPGNRAIITEYFEAVGWSWHVPGGYVERADNPWCGIGLAYAGLRLGDFLDTDQCVGVMLDYELANKALPSTSRMNNPNKWPDGKIADHWDWRSGKLDELTKAIEEYPQICTIAAREYGDYRDRIGGHFVMAWHVAADLVHTVEFNGVGETGDGKKGVEGVVKTTRRLEDFRRAYFFDARHFDVLGRP